MVTSLSLSLSLMRVPIWSRSWRGETRKGWHRCAVPHVELQRPARRCGDPEHARIAGTRCAVQATARKPRTSRSELDRNPGQLLSAHDEALGIRPRDIFMPRSGIDDVEPARVVQAGFTVLSPLHRRLPSGGSVGPRKSGDRWVEFGDR